MKLRNYLIMFFWCVFPIAIFAKDLGATQQTQNSLLTAACGFLIAILWWVVQQWLKDKKESEKRFNDTIKSLELTQQKQADLLAYLSEQFKDFKDNCKINHIRK